MQLASQGTRVAARKAPNFLASRHHPSSISSRAIHIPPIARVLHQTPTLGYANKLITQSRRLLHGFFGHLTTPGTLRSPTIPSVGRSMQSVASGQTIQRGLSLPVRTALSRPLNTTFLPRAPAVPRCTTQVGLGTARNFSSSRPIFQNLVENVPVAGRAFWEADWDIKMREERAKMVKPSKRKQNKSSSKEMIKPNRSSEPLHAVLLKDDAPASEQNIDETEIDHYFPAPGLPNVTTYLLIPLPPTPTARVPLPECTSTPPSLLPLSAIASLHYSHTTHALRVSSLFARLDTARVWERGVACSAYSHGTAVAESGMEGACTVLKLEFEGWTKAEVRSVIGESGTGWCVLEEERDKHRNGNRNTSDDDYNASETSSVLSELPSETDDRAMDSFSGWYGEMDTDRSQSLVLPTLDFSASFHGASPRSPSWEAELLSRPSSPSSPSSCLDSLSDSGSDISDGSWLVPPSESIQQSMSNASSWFGFSSEFAARAGGFGDVTYEPRECVF